MLALQHGCHQRHHMNITITIAFISFVNLVIITSSKIIGGAVTKRSAVGADPGETERQYMPMRLLQRCVARYCRIYLGLPHTEKRSSEEVGAHAGPCRMKCRQDADVDEVLVHVAPSAGDFACPWRCLKDPAQPGPCLGPAVRPALYRRCGWKMRSPMPGGSCRSSSRLGDQANELASHYRNSHRPLR